MSNPAGDGTYDRNPRVDLGEYTRLFGLLTIRQDIPDGTPLAERYDYAIAIERMSLSCAHNPPADAVKYLRDVILLTTVR